MAGRLLYGGKVQTVQFQLLLRQVMHINCDKLIFTYKAYLRIKHPPPSWSSHCEDFPALILNTTHLFPGDPSCLPSVPFRVVQTRSLPIKDVQVKHRHCCKETIKLERVKSCKNKF